MRILRTWTVAATFLGHPKVLLLIKALPVILETSIFLISFCSIKYIAIQQGKANLAKSSKMNLTFSKRCTIMHINHQQSEQYFKQQSS